MRLSASEPGIAVSGAAHLALLLATLFVFSDANRFEDAQESVPVEIITDSQFSQIMKGEKTAPEVKPDAKARADKVADVTETKPTPPVAEAKRDVPPPPPPRSPDPGDDHQVPKPTPVAAPPPPRPEPVKSVAPEPEPKPSEPLNDEAEAKVVPQPPKKIRPAEKQPDAKPKTEDKPTLDQVASFLEQKKLEELTKAEPKAAAKPKSGEEQPPPHRFDKTAISKLLTKEAPQQTVSTAKDITATASLGSPTANAAKMSPSLWGQLDGYLQEQYKRCWNYIGLGGSQKYIPQIRVRFNPDGSLGGEPALTNPPADPAMRSLADSAMRAVRMCNPLHIPTQFQPYYEQWKGRVLRFDPDEMSG